RGCRSVGQFGLCRCRAVRDHRLSEFRQPRGAEVFWTFRQAVTGIADACRALKIPVVGGNVSFYNESPDGPIPPTPVITMVGVIADVSRTARIMFASAGASIALVGPPATDLAASSFLTAVHGLDAGRPADVVFEIHQRMLSVVREAVARGWVTSAHDCSDGGVAVALAECAILGRIGAEVTLPDTGRLEATLFGEAPSRFVVSGPAAGLAEMQTLAASFGVPVHLVGTAGGERLRLKTTASGPTRWAIDLPLEALSDAYAALGQPL
ncbi:MAG TPA: AIR synthase-related protein, partial [bacterium]|nr:AIR synthase-related protein [bacterium]